MAAAASSASTPVTNIHSPRSAGDAAAASLSSPQSRRSAAARGAWNQIVRGGESDWITSSSSDAAVVSAPAAPSSPSSSAAAIHEQITLSSSEWTPSMVAPVNSSSSPSPDDWSAEFQALQDNSDFCCGNSNVGRKPAWNKPSNAAVLELAPVMGADSWPALSESTRASPKSSSSESLKALSDGSIAVSQGTGNSTPSAQKLNTTNNANPSSIINHVGSSRQKSTRPSGKSVLANGGFPQPQPQPQPPSLILPGENTNNAGKYGSAVPESSPRDHTHKETGQRGNFGSQPRGGGGNDHVQRNSFRRGNGGPHPRGDGFYHHNYGNRRDQDRGNHEWNTHRSFNGRDAHMQPQRGVPRTFIRPPHNPTQFVPPPPMPVPVPVPVPVRSFGGPMMYSEMPSPVIYVPAPPPESIRGGVPFVASIQPPPIFFPAPDSQLHSKIVTQIDYYFSSENLIKDTFLRRNMDDQGWVPIKLIAGFKKVMQLTDNVPLILDAVRASNVVEVQADKVRKRNDWMRWLMPPPVQFSGLPSRMQNVSIGGGETAERGHGGD